MALTRGRNANHVYVATHELLALDEDERLDRSQHDPDARVAREVLEAIINREGAPLSATETIRENQRIAASLATLVPRYLHAAEQADMLRYQELVTDVFDVMTAQHLTADPAFPALIRSLRSGETAGWQPKQLLAMARQHGPVAHTDTPARLLAWRCDAIAAEHPVPNGALTNSNQHALLPWLATSSLSIHPEYDTYLTGIREQIHTRITSLALDATIHRPAWTTVFGPVSTDPDTRQEWLHHLGIAAAYRDQYLRCPDVFRQ